MNSVSVRETALTSTTTNDDIRQLRDGLRGTLGVAEGDGPPTVDPSWREGWPALAALGVTGFCVAERHGGFGLHVEAAVATAQELGAALHGSPYAGVTASAHALAGLENELVAAVLAGDRLCAFGVLDAGRRVARVVDGVAEADALLLVDRGAGELVLLAEPSEWSVDASRHTFDVTRTAGDVTVEAGAGRRLPANEVSEALHRLLLAADAVGCVQRVLDRTVVYAGQRIAFGRPIGGFQAVQHRLADHAVRTRGMSLLVAEAAGLLAAGAGEARRHVALAEVSVSSNATRILHDLLQLTGAIGFTWEYGLHFYERRVHHDARLATNPRAAVRSLTEVEGWGR